MLANRVRMGAVSERPFDFDEVPNLFINGDFENGSTGWTVQAENASFRWGNLELYYKSPWGNPAVYQLGLVQKPLVCAVLIKREIYRNSSNIPQFTVRTGGSTAKYIDIPNNDFEWYLFDVAVGNGNPILELNSEPTNTKVVLSRAILSSPENFKGAF